MAFGGRSLTGQIDLAHDYEALWQRERKYPIEAYYEIRGEFNNDRNPAKLLYLLARCVKNTVQFNPAGQFDPSPDKRRAGMRPEVMAKELEAAHGVLAGIATAVCGDYVESSGKRSPATSSICGLPYQGTSEGRDSRYIKGVTRQELVEGLQILNGKRVPFILSYDGSCGDRNYGEPLPDALAHRILLNVGRSSQATLNGRDDQTASRCTYRACARKTANSPHTFPWKISRNSQIFSRDRYFPRFDIARISSATVRLFLIDSLCRRSNCFMSLRPDHLNAPFLPRRNMGVASRPGPIAGSAYIGGLGFAPVFAVLTVPRLFAVARSAKHLVGFIALIL